jgi:uncharacterized membrane protein YoaK (UPF0700 family)
MARAERPPHAQQHGRGRELLVLLLAALSGATDAIGFLALGGAFTSVMTGNMVLLGLSVGTGDADLAWHAGAAIVSFAAGVALGARIAGAPRPEDGPWPPAVTRALTVELALFVLFAIAWQVAGGTPTAELTQVLLLALTAVALGLQSGAILRLGLPGLSTTYLTGTLTTAVTALVRGRPLGDAAQQSRLIAGVVVGAGVGGVVVTHAPRLAPLLQLALLASVLVGARRGVERH